MGGGKHTGGQVPDGLQGLAHDGRGAQEETVGIEEFPRHLGGVCLHHVIGAHVDVAALPDALGDGLGQLASVAVGADVGDDDGGLGLGLMTVDHWV